MMPRDKLIPPAYLLRCSSMKPKTRGGDVLRPWFQLVEKTAEASHYIQGRLGRQSLLSRFLTGLVYFLQQNDCVLIFRDKDHQRGAPLLFAGNAVQLNRRASILNRMLQSSSIRRTH